MSKYILELEYSEEIERFLAYYIAGLGLRLHEQVRKLKI